MSALNAAKIIARSMRTAVRASSITATRPALASRATLKIAASAWHRNAGRPAPLTSVVKELVTALVTASSASSDASEIFAAA